MRRRRSCTHGSSPHARGAQRRTGMARIRPGLIPACAGSTHGHVRPRVLARRLIPACAGSTSRSRRARSRRWAHPRMRGEHERIAASDLDRTGSSPHARGAPGERADGVPPGGLIPACAGSTTRSACRTSRTWAHPRMRGEHEGDGDTLAKGDGSSPHARGAPSSGSRSRRSAGLIPACAGSTAVSFQRPDETRAHPRMRGEHFPGRPVTQISPGSSPHARGALVLMLAAQSTRRLIPACAGSTPPGGT